MIIKAAENTQVWVVTHSPVLIAALREGSEARVIELQKELGQTEVRDQNLLTRPQWRWVE
jgi:predicted ATPase